MLCLHQPPLPQLTGESIEGINPDAAIAAEKGKHSGKTVEETILDLVRKNPTITLKELAFQLNQSKDGIRYHTNKLKTKGVLRRVGTKNGYWEIISQKPGNAI